MTGLEIVLAGGCVFFAVLALQEWLIASVEREKRKQKAESASFWRDMYRESEGYHERTHEALCVERRRRVQAEARLDSTGAAWADSLRRERRAALPTLHGPRDPEWVARGDSPVLDGVRDDWSNNEGGVA